MSESHDPIKRISEEEGSNGFCVIPALVSTLSDHYGFTKKYCDTKKLWIIRGGEMNCDFFWTSDEGAEEFMDQLKVYFEDLGYEKSIK